MTSHITPTIDMEGLSPSNPNVVQEGRATDEQIVLPGDKRPTSVEPENRPTSDSPKTGINFKMMALGIISIANLMLGCFNYWHAKSLSYNDLNDAPIIYYSDNAELAKLAGQKKDPNAFVEDLIKNVRANHGIVLDRNAIMIAAPEYRLLPAQTGDSDLPSAANK